MKLCQVHSSLIIPRYLVFGACYRFTGTSNCTGRQTQDAAPLRFGEAVAHRRLLCFQERDLPLIAFSICNIDSNQPNIHPGMRLFFETDWRLSSTFTFAQDTSPVALMLQSMSASPINASIASISRFTATVLTLLLDSPPSRFEEAMTSISDIFGNLETMTKQIERDWISCSLSNCTEEGIGEPDLLLSPFCQLSKAAPESREMTKKLWATMKTLLFTIVMLTESVLSGVVFLPPQSSSVTPATLANKVLNSLSHLSFVISEFGGVITLSQGFEQLKKTFYLALDILAQGEWGSDDNGSRAEDYVRGVCSALNSMRKESGMLCCASFGSLLNLSSGNPTSSSQTSLCTRELGATDSRPQ